MKRICWFLAGLLVASAIGKMPFSGTDVAQLQPVEVIRIQKDGDLIQIETDTGDTGRGIDLGSAFQNLKDSTVGKIFLETADYLLIAKDMVKHLPALAEYLRPACGVCESDGQEDLGTVGSFLQAHEPEITISDCQDGHTELPRLITSEERMKLVS